MGQACWNVQHEELRSAEVELPKEEPWWANAKLSGPKRGSPKPTVDAGS